MRDWRRAWRWMAPPCLALLAAVTWWLRSPQLSASLYELIGGETELIPEFVRDAASSEIAIMVSAPDATVAQSTARSVVAILNADTRLADSDRSEAAALEFLREHRAGLVTPASAELLRTKAGRAKLAKRALRRSYASPVPPLLGYADDPFGLTEGFVTTRLPKPQTMTAEGFPMLVTNGLTHVLVRRRLEATIVDDLDRTIACCDEIRDRIKRLIVESAADSGMAVRFGGSPIHAATAASRCRSEIGALTWFSLAVIAVLALFAFRSLRWLPLLAGSLTVSALAGILALGIGFREIHVMTLVMGTTVLGLVIDYSFHWLLAPAAAKATVRRGLCISWATTEVSLTPLMLASIPVLRQSAVFLGVALTAALVYVLTTYPATAVSDDCDDRRPRVDGKWRGGRWWGWLVALIAVAGLCLVEFKTEVGSLYRPTPELAAAEQLRANFGTFDFSVFPTYAQRCEIAEQVAMLYSEQGDELARALGLPSLVPPPAPQMLQLEPQALMNSILNAWTEETLTKLGISGLVLLVVLLVLTRRRALRILLPPVAAILIVAGGLGWRGVPINLFHLLAAFLLLGMGIDYAVFVGSGERSAFKPAFCSMLTSVAGFGALAFVAFPVVAAFGIVLGWGLPLAFGFSLLVGHRPPPAVELAATEHGASLLGMELLLWQYRIFGLRALHLLSAMTGVAIWLFSPTVRRASPRIGKLVNFTRALADKLVVMAEGRRLPQVRVDAHPDATEFLAAVRDGKGVFVLSSHVGTIEVLMVLGECTRTFHAWMDFARTGVFNRFYLRHAQRHRVVIHPISEFGLQTVFAAGDIIDSGDCLLMAGDWGDGAFRFAAAFDHPVYFVACLAEHGCSYRAVIRRLPSDRKAMKSAYVKILASLVEAYPDQHFVWSKK